eukprot:3092787-Lingulodinium_polyedra.AAC.1
MLARRAPRGAAVAASWPAFRPGVAFLVRYSDDDVWRERLAVHPVDLDGHWANYTPDKGLCAEQ